MKFFSLSCVGFLGFSSLLLQGDESFAFYLPQDCAVYLEVFNESGLLSSEIADIFVEQKELLIEEAEGLLPLEEGKVEEAAEAFESGDDVSNAIGSRLVMAMGGEANELVGDAGELYQEFSGLMAGAQLEALLALVKMFSEEGLVGPEAMGELAGNDALAGLNKFQVGAFLDSLVEENRVVMPSVYLAFKPSEKNLEDAWNGLAEAVSKEEEKADSMMERVPLSGGKWPRRGVRFKEDATTAQELRTWWEGLTEEERGPFDEKRFEKLEAALLSFRLTLMWAKVDGWLVFYAGNGSDGFRLEEDPSLSVAADGKLAKMTEMSGSANAWTRWRVSEEFLKGVPAWMNDSPSVRAQALVMADHVELKNQQAMIDALYGIAKSRSLMSRREVESDWYGIGWLEEGLRIETFGGMRKPGLDYDTAWTMSGGAKSAGTFMRAQWVGEESRTKWGWEQTESLVTLVGSALAEWMPEEGPVSREFLNENVRGWMSTMAQSGKEMSLQGLGRESVVAVDFLGEMPQVPDAPEEALKDGKIPRFLVARTVSDRAQVEKSGREMMDASKVFWKQVNEEMGSELPFPGVVSSEDDGLDSSLIFLPFSNDDFHLYSGLNDEVLIQGTSRKQAQLFEVGRKKKGEPESGFFLEINLRSGVSYLNLWDGLLGSTLLQLEEADALLEEAGLDPEQSVEEQMSKARILRYHHRKEEGELRSSFSFELAK